MTNMLKHNDRTIEDLMKDAMTTYMLDSLDIEDRLKDAVQKIAVELLAKELAALRGRAAMAKAPALQIEEVWEAA